MNIRIPYIMNPTHEGKYSTTITKNSKIKKEAVMLYKAIIYRPRIAISKRDIFG